MKNRILFSLLAILSVNPAFAADEVQYIDCHFYDMNKEERVIVSLQNEKAGTLFITTGFDDFGNDRNTGKLTLKSAGDSKTQKGYAVFAAQWKTESESGPVSVDFTFSLPKNALFKKTDDMKAFITTKISSQGMAAMQSEEPLFCFSRLYPVGNK